MKKLILIRHGESEWNKLNLFTGWTDVDLTENGCKEAFEAGKLLKAEGYKPELCFTSYLKRAVKTLNNVLDAMNMDYLPVEKSWRLNEKSYGAISESAKTIEQAFTAVKQFYNKLKEYSDSDIRDFDETWSLDQIVNATNELFEKIDTEITLSTDYSMNQQAQTQSFDETHSNITEEKSAMERTVFSLMTQKKF
jgi:bisphosphoglycerate-dependent phosphoglycerate mutase family 1